jgi:hypothetical protein
LRGCFFTAPLVITLVPYSYCVSRFVGPLRIEGVNVIK